MFKVVALLAVAALLPWVAEPAAAAPAGVPDALEMQGICASYPALCGACLLANGVLTRVGLQLPC